MYVTTDFFHKLLTPPFFCNIAFSYVYLLIRLILLPPAESNQDSVNDVSANTTRSLRSWISSACGH